MDNFVAEQERIAEERRIADEEAYAAEMEERADRIEYARQAYEEGESQHRDATNELELYKELLKELNPEDDAEAY